ncbi:DoxX family protein [Mucilaginibacter sp. OK098]|uniref:DoxX family protein n=1 Tax=Mucilaginibacter sp. OK098 TaxID=1855297 RepID=UPI000919AF55|nr:DoxX family protein [Mucilaginibacter sp. OK098]SHN36853.1 putative oxidoreductase [Mucilaginibacter sp. OK098]
MLKQLLSSNAILKNWMILIRIIIGIIIAKYGLEIFNHDKMKGNVAWLTDIHLPTPVFMAYLGKATELIGGGLLIIGLCTRLASIALVINMAVITFLMGKGEIWGSDQLPFLFLLLFASFIFYGAGKWSFDYLLFDKKNKY